LVGLVRKLITNEISLTESKHIVHEDNVQLKRLYFAWHSDKGYGQYDASLDILAEILAGSKSSRLYKYLVHELEIAQDVSAFQYSAKYNGVFFIMISLKPGAHEDIIRKSVFKVLEELNENGIEEDELERAKNLYRSSFIYSLQNLENIANQLNNYNCYLKEPNSFGFDLERYANLQKSDINKAVDNYLTKNYVELFVIPKYS
jgi:zinc protease